MGHDDLHRAWGTQKALPRASRPQQESALVAPVQRLGRVVLQLKAINKRTAQTHPDKPLLRQALQEFSAAAKHVDQLMAQSEHAQDILEFRDRFASCPLTAVADDALWSQRQLLYTGPLHKMDRHGSLRQVEGFLFSDAFMYSKDVFTN